jgi:hypothetical protein
MPRSQIAAVVTLLAAAVIVVALFAGRAPDVATPSPSPLPSSPTPTATATGTPTSAPTPTTTASPSPASQGLYLSKRLGYAIELPTPWRPANCGSSDPLQTRMPLGEEFTSASPMEEEIGDIASPHDRVHVILFDNPQKLSPTDFAASHGLPGAGPSGPAPPTRSVTFAGRPAAEVRWPEPHGPRGYYVAEGDFMYAVAYSIASRESATPDTATRLRMETMLRIVQSFRFLSAGERQALPDPTPIPAAAPTAQALAGMLKTAFDQKDVAALERLLSPCVIQGNQNGGGSAITRQAYVAQLRTQLANGLTVVVNTSAVRTDTSGSGDSFVRAGWTDPGQQPRNVDLILARTRDGLYWLGVLNLRS